MTLPYDYTRCARSDCPLDCRRKEPGRPGYQSFSDFPGGPDCHGHIPPQRRAARPVDATMEKG
jgi:hypothetical protein